jgi:hypothetical protein
MRSNEFEVVGRHLQTRVHHEEVNGCGVALRVLIELLGR